MAEKVTMQGLIDVFCKENLLLTKDQGESLVKAVFDIVIEGLKRDKIVKIKGLGTFKVIEIEPRQSVNVNTGERIQIAGHNKVAFVPDNAIKTLINQPFSDFETIILSDNIAFDDNKQQEISDLNVKSDVESETIIDEEAVETIAETSLEENTLNSETKDQENMETKELENAPEEEVDNIEKPIREIIENGSCADDSVMTVNQETTTEEGLEEEVKSDMDNVDDSVAAVDQKPATEVVKEEEKLSGADEIIANELRNAPKHIANEDLIGISKSKKTKKKHVDASYSPKVAMGLFIVILLTAFGFIIYWFITPENTPVPQNSKISNEYQDSVQNSGKADTLTMADKALMLAQSSDLDAMDDSSKKQLVGMVETERRMSSSEANKSVSETTPADRPMAHRVPNVQPKEVSNKGNAVVSNTGKLKIVGLKTTHVMAKGDNLYVIAKTYLGSKDKIKYLLQYNNIKNPNLVTIGTKIRIPQLSE
jgi:nucleoid DNA-binding protein/LysM repeat protein